MSSSLEQINTRIDDALKGARRLENIVTMMALALFIVGLAVFVAGFVLERDFVIVTGALLEGAVIWPMKKLMDIRDQNIRLGVIPSLTQTIHGDEFQKDILLKLIEKV